MYDDKLKELFKNFQPELSTDDDFVGRIERNINSVELIMQEAASMKRRSRRSFCVGAAVGFIAGLIMSQFVPFVCRAISEFRLSMPDSNIIGLLSDFQSTLAWLLVGATSVILALNSYDLMQAIQPARRH